MEIRQAERGESRAVAELLLHAFPGERTLAERIHALETGGVFGGIEATLVACEGPALVGSLRAYRMTQYIGGAALPMMGLASVAVAPSARRRGLANLMCRHVLGFARERGDVLSALFPFRPAFYRELGWALVGELHSYRFAPEQLRASGDGGELRLAGKADEAAVAQCYDQVARRSNGLVAREPRVWRQHLDEPDTHAFVVEGDELRGYVIVGYGRSRSAATRPLHVRELIATNGTAYESLITWISRQRDLWRVVRYDAAPDEHFALRLTDPRRPGFRPSRRLWAPIATVIRGPMLRVLDVPAALQRRLVWGAAPAHAFTLELTDPQLPENAGPFAVEFDGERAHVRAGRAGDAVIRTDAPTFAQLYTGEIGVAAAARLGLAEVEGDTTAVEAMLRPAHSFRLLDLF